jgi:hypothetical protein
MGLIVSANSNIVSSTSALADWYLSNPFSPGSWVNFDVVPPWTRKVTRQGAVFHPLGRKFPVIVNDSVSGIGGKLVTRTYDDITHNKLLALIMTTDTLLLQSPFPGQQYYIQIAGDSSGGSGSAADINDTMLAWSAPSQPSYQTEFEYIQVDAP